MISQKGGLVQIHPVWFYPRSKNKRLPKETYSNPEIAWFITVRAYMHQAPFTNDNLCKMVLDVLKESRLKYDCLVFVYCLMPDHLHYITKPRKTGASVLTFTERFKGKTTTIAGN